MSFLLLQDYTMFPFLREYWNSKTLLPINKIITFKLLIPVRLFRWNSTRNGNTVNRYMQIGNN